MTISNEEPRYLRKNGIVLITIQGGPDWSKAGRKASLPKEGGRRYLALSRIPEALHQEMAVIIGEGYLVLAPVDVARRLGIPKIEVAPPIIRTIHEPDKIAEPLPRVQAQHYRLFKVFGDKQSVSFLDVGGSVWDDIGCTPESVIKVTRYQDGFVVEKIAEDNSHASRLTRKLTATGKVYAHKRFGSRLLRVIGDTSVRVVTAGDKLYFFGPAVALKDFGIPEGTAPVLRKQRIY